MLSSDRLLLSIGQQPSDIEAIQLLCPEPLLSDGQQPSNIEATPILCAQANSHKPFVVPREDHRICPFKRNYKNVS